MGRTAEKRKFHHKSKAGCRTCKIRRVKCDETKPLCNRCRRLGITCDGYQTLSAIDDSQFDSALERRSFFFFRDKTLPELDSFAKFSFWDRMVLRQSYDGCAVRAVLAAIGATHEALETEAAYAGLASRSPRLASVSAKRRERDHNPATAIMTAESRSVIEANEAAAELYHRALSVTSRTLFTMKISDVLMITILLAFLENIQGSSGSASRHLGAARNILREYRRAQRVSSPGNETNVEDSHASPEYARSIMVEDVLAPIAMELCGLQATIYENALPSDAGSYKGGPDNPFESFLDASDHFHRTAQKISECLPIDTLPDQAVSSPYFRLLEYWYRNFEAFLRSPASECNCPWPRNHAHHSLGAAYLEIEYLLARVNLWVALAPDCRKATAMDDEIVSGAWPRIAVLAEQIMRVLRATPEEMSARGLFTTRKCLGFLTNHVLGCFQLAEGCRDPNLRRKAVAILRAWHLKGRWDSYVVADMAEAFIKYEENLALQMHRRQIIASILARPDDILPAFRTKSVVEHSSDVPEEARCWFVTDVLFGESGVDGAWTLLHDNLASCKSMKVVVLRRVQATNEECLLCDVHDSTGDTDAQSTLIECSHHLVAVKETLFLDRFSGHVLHRTQKHDNTSIVATDLTSTSIAGADPVGRPAGPVSAPPRNVAGFFPQLEKRPVPAPDPQALRTSASATRRPSDSSGTNLWSRLRDSRNPSRMFRDRCLRIMHPPCDRLSHEEEIVWRSRRAGSPSKALSAIPVVADRMSNEKLHRTAFAAGLRVEPTKQINGTKGRPASTGGLIERKMGPLYFTV
ncbi:uncharacterized protein AB675_4624 [Cyphellophora attinorum]|uniref:Zn(2)-C6 fungal-type domain-containing protein n=1 Tax=Cyphellophora attinorum TaxID=1664694 RepID=A0A0N0NLA3_9EURO|nr:uncharacterized protein AB675_4624 [Phialophora attinorum]KPI39061.1 hypothetical protein AB675_4624 [Phialophora attinorum]